MAEITGCLACNIEILSRFSGLRSSSNMSDLMTKVSTSDVTMRSFSETMSDADSGTNILCSCDLRLQGISLKTGQCYV